MKAPVIQEGKEMATRSEGQNMERPSTTMDLTGEHADDDGDGSFEFTDH